MKYLMVLLSIAVVFLLSVNASNALSSFNRHTIELVLANGGTATLVCPKFLTPPSGAHGRECYLTKITQEAK